MIPGFVGYEMNNSQDDLFPKPHILAPDYALDGTEIVEGIRFKKPDQEAENPPNNPTGKDLRVETAKWIKANPVTSNLFFEEAKKCAKKGRKFGINALAERVRWEVTIEWGLPFKVNNNHNPYIARWIIARDPSIEPFIRFRHTKY